MNFLINIRKFSGLNSRVPLHNNFESDAIKQIIEKHLDKPNLASLQQEVLSIDSRRIDKNNVDYLILCACNNEKSRYLALKYVDFLRQSGSELNLASTSKLLKIYGILRDENVETIDGNKNVESEIIKEYKSLTEKYKILDASLTESVITALSKTKQWQECQKVFKSFQSASTPTAPSYNALIQALFKHHEFETAWSLLQEMVNVEKNPSSTCFLTFLSSISKFDYIELCKHLEVFFNYLSVNDILITEDVAHLLTKIVKPHNKIASISKINLKGECSKCKTTLPKNSLSLDEFNHLKKAFFDKVIVGKDVFRKTTPTELTSFKELLQQKQHYDVIIDGLNVAYSAGVKKPVFVTSGMVLNVAQHYVRQKKSVLILGRNHMKKWPHIREINKCARLFLTQNLSQDDPYLLYCALNSGQGTVIVSRDLMRGHLHLLKEPNLKQLFKRWISVSRHVLIYAQKDGNVSIKTPPPYILSAQKHNETWHLPCETTTSEVPQNGKPVKKDPSLWLCIKLQQ